MTLEEEVAAFQADLRRGRARARSAFELAELAHLERTGRPYVVRLELQHAADRMRGAADRIRAASRRS